MYKIEKIKIDGFWSTLQAECKFVENVNIIIGRNGTGKTTFMNILYAALSVDIESLLQNDFDNIEIKLRLKTKKKTIKVSKIMIGDSPVPLIEYQISSNKYRLKGITQNNRNYPPSYRRIALEESNTLKEELKNLVSLSSLSVYRLRSGEDLEVKDRLGKRIISPVDFRLSQLESALIQYQLELAQTSQNISRELQKDVLSSILYSKTESSRFTVPSNFDSKKEKSELLSAYRRLGVTDSKIIKKVAFHISEVDKAATALKDRKEDDDISKINFTAFEAFSRTRDIIKMSLLAEESINNLYQQIKLFIKILEEFIIDKKFSLDSGELEVKTLVGDIMPIEKLSSGEKQLLILLIETLLQKSKPYIYLTDEPELSLHIEWQRNIIPAVRRLNPSAQIIAATHSPEVASTYKKSLINMKNVIKNG